jgi:GT2 family glycosyltransferase
VAISRALTRPWFEYMPDNMGLPAVTEDVAFCARARSVGCPILVDPAIQCGHIGQQVITSAWYKRAMVERELLAQMKKDGQNVKGFDALFGNGAASERGSAA